MKIHKIDNSVSLTTAIVFAGMIVCAGLASASPVVTPVLTANTPTYSIPTDLLSGLTPMGIVGSPTDLNGSNPFPTGTLSSLTDNSVTNNNTNGIAAGASENAVTELTYALGGSYNITSATTFTGWSDDGRYAQNLTLSFSSDGTNFTSYASTNSGGVGGANEDTVTFTDTTGTLYSGATYVRFDFGPVANWSDYSELSLSGTIAAAPEPNAAYLLSGGLLALAILLRRKRSTI